MIWSSLRKIEGRLSEEKNGDSLGRKALIIEEGCSSTCWDLVKWRRARGCLEEVNNLGEGFLMYNKYVYIPSRNNEGQNGYWYPKMDRPMESHMSLLPQSREMTTLNRDFWWMLWFFFLIFVIVVVVLMSVCLFVTIRNLSILYLELDQAWHFWIYALPETQLV